MNLALKKTTCRALVISVLALSFQSANAGMIGAEQAAGATMSAERAMVLGSLDRAEVVAQMQLAGVDPMAARERVKTMSEAEVQSLAQDIQAAPAGAGSAWAIIVVILIAAAIWYYVIRK